LVTLNDLPSPIRSELSFWDGVVEFFSTSEAGNAGKPVTAGVEEKKEEVKLTKVQQMIADEAKPALQQLLNDPELQQQAWDALAAKARKEWENVCNDTYSFATENPAVVIGCSSLIASGFATGITAAVGDSEDVAMVGVISTALSGSLAASAFILNRQGVDMTSYANVATLAGTVLGSAAFMLTIREIVKRTKAYIDECENPLVPEAKEAPTSLGLVSELACRVGVFAALIGLVCGDVKGLRSVVSAWRDIRWSFEELGKVYHESDLNVLGIKDMEDEIKEAEENKPNDGLLEASTIALYRVIETAKKNAIARKALANACENLVDDNDSENFFGYYPIAKHGGLNAEADEMNADHFNAFVACERVAWLDGPALSDMKALVKAGLVICLNDETAEYFGTDEARLWPKQKKCCVMFMSATKIEPVMESKLLSIAKMGEKIQTYVKENKTQCIVGGFVFASICTAAIAGLLYQYNDKVKIAVAGTVCEIATPMIEYKAPWKRNPKNEAGVEYTDAEMKVFREDGTLPPLDSGVSQSRSSFGFVSFPIVNYDNVFENTSFRKMYVEECFLLFASYQNEGGKRSQKNKSSGDRAKDNQRELAKERAALDFKEMREQVRDARTDFDREQIDDWLSQRDLIEDQMLEIEKHGSIAQKDVYDQLDKEYRKLSWNIFNMYDMYQRTENVSKVTAEAKPVIERRRDLDVPAFCPVVCLEDKGKAEVLNEKKVNSVKGFAPSVTPLFSQGSPTVLPTISVNPQPVWVQPVAPVNPPLCGWEKEAEKQFAESKPVKSAQPKRKRGKRSGKGKKKQIEKLEAEIEKLKQSGPEAPKKRSWTDVVKTPAPVEIKKFKQKKAKEEKKEAEKPRQPKKKDFEKKCGNCGSKDHFTNQCSTLPKGWKTIPVEKWKIMSSAEKRKVHFENSKLLASYKPQSISKHKPIPGSARYHDNLIPIFNPNAGNSGIDKEFWGTMLCASQDNVQYVWITEHQLLPGVYYRGSDGKVYLLPTKEKWTTLGYGNISQCRIPKAMVTQLPSVPHLKVVGPRIGTGFSSLYIGLNPSTMNREFCDTPYSWSGKATDDVIHSASTANFSCGSFLYDSELEAVVASHHGTIGPDSKLGENNLCSPLKAMGPRQ